MKNLLFAAFIFCVMFTTGLAQAQETNLMGLYFDQQGEVDCLDSNVLDPLNTFEMYLILSHPSLDTLHGFEAGLTETGPCLILSHEIVWPGGGCFIPYENIICGFVSPVPMEENNILVTYSVFFTGAPGDGLCFKLHGSSPSSLDPLYPTLLAADGELMTAPVNHGVDAACTAQVIDGGCVVATANRTWGSLKTLYR